MSLPVNAATGRRYSGINILILWDAVASGGSLSQAWLTFRQTLALGGHVRCAQGVTVVYAEMRLGDKASARRVRIIRASA